MSIAENVALVRENMARAARAAGREPGEILLVAATKMNDAERVRQAIAAGVDVCGENRVQEMLQKQAQGAYEGAPLHFIGHLQKNKVKQVVGESSKSGFRPEEIAPVLEKMAEFPNVCVRGLMAIPPICAFPEENRPFFLRMKQLFVDNGRKKYDNVSMDFLSMGMSGDYTEAIACGANLVRVGTAIFGARDYSGK